MISLLSKVGSTILKSSKGNIEEINSISQLSISLVLSQKGLTGQAGHSIDALLNPMRGTLDGTSLVSSLNTHDSSVRHVHYFPFYKGGNWNTLRVSTPYSNWQISNLGFILKSI